MKTNYFNFLTSKTGLFIIPIATLIIGMFFGYGLNKTHVEKLNKELSLSQQTNFSLEQDCHDHKEHND